MRRDMADLVDLLRGSAGRGLQNLQYAMPEALRNYAGKAEWDEKKQAQDLYGGDFEAQERAEKMMGFGTDAAGLVGAIKASHGTPHKFDRFDFTKIGSGEGAQAYGHGGYFAQGFDSPVAKEYRDALSGVELGGKVVQPEWDSPYYYPLKALRQHGGDIDRARTDVYERNKKIPGGWPEELTAFEDAVKQGVKPNQGHLYNVELKWPDPAREAADPLGEHHLLDWDEPLSEQPGIAAKLGFSTKTKDQIHDEYDALVEKHGYYHEMPPEIQAKVEQLQNELNNQVPNLTGEQFYSGNTENDYLHSVLSGKKFSKEQSDYLRELGIPGIRYLDQGSRAAGDGTRNYVIFDDQIPEIVTRDGEAIVKALRGAK